MHFSGSQFFLEHRSQFDDPKARAGLFHKIADDLGLENLTFTRIHARTTQIRREELVTTYPREWCDRYFNRSYHEIDPLIQNARCSVGPIEWNVLRTGADVVKNFQNDAADFGIFGHGMVFPVRHRNGDVSMISAHSRMSNRDWELFRQDVLGDLMALAFYVSAGASTNSVTAGSPAFDLLTKREREVLFWAARGKSCWETGEILQLTERTVNDYIQKAARKLNATSKTHAVALVIQSGIIELGYTPAPCPAILQY